MSGPFLSLMLVLLAFSFSITTKSAFQYCFQSILSFGDSLTDTGNFVILSRGHSPPASAHPPFGETFFHRPTGRCSDGRLVLDFIAVSYGLPLVPPYLGGEKGGRNFSKGVNFAVDGAAVLSDKFYEKMGINKSYTYASLEVQWHWFQKFLATRADGRKFLENSLIVMGEIGANDYFKLVDNGKNMEEILGLAPRVVKLIGSKIKDAIHLGARTIFVPGIPPRGCVPSAVALYSNNRTTLNDDDQMGCVDWLNHIVRRHNNQLQRELSRIRKRYPSASIIYGDYYNNMKRIYVSPHKFGFKELFKACCGAGGPYNFVPTKLCGFDADARSCKDPSVYASWEGFHFTEGVYRVMTHGFLHGPYTIPHIKKLCPNIIKLPHFHSNK